MLYNYIVQYLRLRFGLIPAFAGRRSWYPNVEKTREKCTILDQNGGDKELADNTVYLLVGPRASGKSQYVKGLVSREPGLSVVSRDEILVRRFGSTDTNPYTGCQYYAQTVMYRLLRRKLFKRAGVRLVLDTWTGSCDERRAVITRLRKCGATRIVALYFVTPVGYVREWFWLKPKIAKFGEMGQKRGEGCIFFSEDAPERDHALFHRLAKGIDSDGFDQVVRVNPLEPLVVLE